MITVGIAAYNVAPFIEKSVLSVLNQDYPYLDVLVVDDNSQDETFEIVERISSTHPKGGIIRIIRNNFNKGILSIGAKTINVTADAKTKTYGDANPTLTYSKSGEVCSQTAGFSGNIATSATATSGTNISGATSSTYTIGTGLVGKYIGVTVNIAAGTNWNAASAATDITDATNNTTATVSKATPTITLSKTSAEVNYDAIAQVLRYRQELSVQQG